MKEENKKFKVSLSPKRLEEETYEEYKIRQKLINTATRKYLKGRTLWNPKYVLPMKDENGNNYIAGPYVEALHGKLVSGLNLKKEENDTKDEVPIDINDV